ncbi:ABC transporter permease [Streptomyces boninensis]|uniref:ABC transporter permease n=1 Tax=Streptomyces boninensis TaxID=2039455 RepID=UPI003B21B394
MTAIEAVETTAAPAAAEQAGHGILRRYLRQPAAVAGLALFALLVLLSLVGPLVLPSGTHIDPAHRFAAPSGGHWFGTDELGRDVLARVAAAGRLSLGIAIGATAVSFVAGAAWGLAAAATRGWADDVLMRIADAAMAIPIILFALVFVAALGTTVPVLLIVTGLLMAPLTARVARSAVLAELESDYVRALTAVGVPKRRIMAREVLPNASPALLAQASLNLATSLMVEASLSFVGLGVQPPDASWGTLLQAGYAKLFQSIWYPLMPALVILAAIAALNTIGDQLQRVLYRSGS